MPWLHPNHMAVIELFGSLQVGTVDLDMTPHTGSLSGSPFIR